jgi:hypothetical protein
MNTISSVTRNTEREFFRKDTHCVHKKNTSVHYLSAETLYYKSEGRGFESPLSRHCGILNISQSFRPAWSVSRIDLLFAFIT